MAETVEKVCVFGVLSADFLGFTAMYKLPYIYADVCGHWVDQVFIPSLKSYLPLGADEDDGTAGVAALAVLVPQQRHHLRHLYTHHGRPRSCQFQRRSPILKTLCFSIMGIFSVVQIPFSTISYTWILLR